MRTTRLLGILLVAASVGPARADDVKLYGANTSPRVLFMSSPSLVRGRTNNVILRGANLAGVTAAWLDGFQPTEAAVPSTQPAATQPSSTQPASTQPASPQAAAEASASTQPAAAVRIAAKGKSEAPKPFDATRVGDSQVTLDVLLPEGELPETIALVLLTPAGEVKSPPFHVLAAAAVIEEQEPNGGFATAQPVEIGKVIRGAIQAPEDVDVFRFQGRAGEGLRLEVLAARAGSLLDSSLALYDDRGHLLAGNDDSALGQDSLIEYKLPADGVYFVSITDAAGAGSPVHGYQLTIANVP